MTAFFLSAFLWPSLVPRERSARWAQKEARPLLQKESFRHSVTHAPTEKSSGNDRKIKKWNTSIPAPACLPALPQAGGGVLRIRDENTHGQCRTICDTYVDILCSCYELKNTPGWNVCVPHIKLFLLPIDILSKRRRKTGVHDHRKQDQQPATLNFFKVYNTIST